MGTREADNLTEEKQRGPLLSVREEHAKRTYSNGWRGCIRRGNEYVKVLKNSDWVGNVLVADAFEFFVGP